MHKARRFGRCAIIAILSGGSSCEGRHKKRRPESRLVADLPAVRGKVDRNEQLGSAMHFEFSASLGQQVFVQVPDSGFLMSKLELLFAIEYHSTAIANQVSRLLQYVISFPSIVLLPGHIRAR